MNVKVFLINFFNKFKVVGFFLDIIVKLVLFVKIICMKDFLNKSKSKIKSVFVLYKWRSFLRSYLSMLFLLSILFLGLLCLDMDSLEMKWGFNRLYSFLSVSFREFLDDVDDELLGLRRNLMIVIEIKGLMKLWKLIFIKGVLFLNLVYLFFLWKLFGVRLLLVKIVFIIGRWNSWLIY